MSLARAHTHTHLCAIVLVHTKGGSLKGLIVTLQLNELLSHCTVPCKCGSRDLVRLVFPERDLPLIVKMIWRS